MAHEILPIELWDNVFSALDTSQSSFLVLSTVCRVFNEVAIARFLLREGVTREALATKDLEIEPCSLRAIALSLSLCPLCRLVCTLPVDGRLLGHLRCLERIIARSPQIEELCLEFSQDILAVGAKRATAALDVVYGLLHRIAQTNSSSVAVLSGAFIFRCNAEDVLQWKLRDTDFAGSSLARARKLFGRRPSAQTPGFVVLRDAKGQAIRLPVLPYLSGISVRRMGFAPPTSPAYLPGTLIEFNPGRGNYLTLGPKRPSPGAHTLSGTPLSAVLTQLYMPSLRFLEIVTDGILLDTLAAFLRRHKATLVQIAYAPLRAYTTPLIREAISLPKLVSLRTNNPIHLIALLDAFGESPALRSLTFKYAANTPSILGPILTRIQAHPRQLALYIQLVDGAVGPSFATPTFSAPVEAATRALTNITTVDIECPSLTSQPTRAIIPWLALFPALERVTFRSTQGIFRWGARRQDPHPNTMRFVESTM
ncbi:hypothetical protein C8F01DRAFT_1185978, partial [Mycena amicta]